MDALLGLIILAVIILLGVFGEIFFKKTGVPDVLWLVLFGFLIAHLLNFVEPVYFDGIMPIFMAITLIIILFEGGLNLKLGGVLKNSLTGMGLAILTFILTTVFVTGITYLLSLAGILPRWSLWTGIILGGMLGGTSSIVVMPLVKIAGFGETKKNILSVESAMTDALCVVVVMTLLVYISSAGQTIQSILQSIASSITIGVVVGVISGFLWLFLLYKLRNKTEYVNYFYFLTIAFLIIQYIFMEFIGGSAVVCIFLFGLIMGNSIFLGKVLKVELYHLDNTMVTMNSQLAFLIKSFFFVLMGVIIVVDLFSGIIAFVLAVALLFVRYLTIKLIPSMKTFADKEKNLLYFFAPKGLAAGILAIEASKYTEYLPGAERYVGIAFSVVILSILFATYGLFMYKYRFKNAESVPVSSEANKKV